MKRIYFLFVIIVAACNGKEAQSEETFDTTAIEKRAETTPLPKIYTNARFKEVTVERTADHQFLIKGKAQVFEANISWAVEDGHDELKKGFVTTDAGAPAWGNFTFIIDVVKKRENSTLTLILFESSAMDGSRQHELPILLY